MMNVKKADIYAYLKEKRLENYKKLVTPLTEEINRLETEYLIKLVSDVGLNYETARKHFKETISKITTLRDRLDYNTYSINRWINTLTDLSNTENILSNIRHSVDFRDIPHIDVLRTKITNTTKELNDEYNKIEAMVRSQNTAKQAYKILEELGFDVSKIKMEVKHELKTLNVNKDLLGLPEKKPK